MIVVSDTTPLNYLVLIDSAHVLPALFGRVYAPSAVIRELAHSRSPELVRRWTDSNDVLRESEWRFRARKLAQSQ
jgi:predicted nucleic acid-binding protein